MGTDTDMGTTQQHEQFLINYNMKQEYGTLRVFGWKDGKMGE